MTLRWRMVLALALLAAAAATAIGFIGYASTRERLLLEVDRSLSSSAAALDRTPEGYRLPDRSVLGEVWVQTLDDDGGVYETMRGASPFTPGTDSLDVVGREDAVRYETVVSDGTRLRVRTEGDGRGGAVQVARSLRETDNVLSDVRWRTAVLVGIVSLLAAGVGWLLARSVVRPLTRLTAAATDVERSGRLDVEVPVAGRDEVGRLGTAFNGMLGALATSRAEQQRLVEDAGHELRTPLTSVRTNLAVLRRHPDLDAGTRTSVLADLDAETEELVGLVEEVVALARGAGDDDPPERLLLGDVARTVAARARRRYDRDVVVHGAGEPVVASRHAVERAISNLVDNAAKFDVGGGPIDVDVHAGTVTVADRGPGIAAEDRDRVFDRFHRAEAARSLPGSGLGLSIVRAVAERHGGGVTVADRPGGGAVVGFWLPVAPGTGPDDTPAGPGGEAVTWAPSGPSPTVGP